VPLEICITSNLQTRAVASADSHPVRRYFDLGIVVCLNTDNRLMSRTTVTDEMLLAHRHLGFGRAELMRLALYGFESAFLPHKEREALVARVKRQLETAAEEAAG
jgi:adenosine deaminase